MLAGVAACLLFVPLIPLTLDQLTQTEGNWIPSPHWTWLFDFMSQYFNESLVINSLFIVLLIYLLIKMENVSSTAKFALSIFICGYVIGFLISKLYTPVLRDMVMLFMLPFAFLFLFSQIAQINLKVRQVLFGTIFFGAVFHTFFIYRILEPTHFGEFRLIGEDLNKRQSKDFTYLSISTHIAYFNYYLNQPIQESITDWSSSETIFKVKERIAQSEHENFAYQYCSDKHNPMYLSMIRTKFPYLKTSNGNLLWADYWFTKGENNEVKKEIHRIIAQKPIVDSLEFLGGFKYSVKDLLSIPKEKYYLKISSAIEIDALSKLQKSYYLVVTINRNNQMLLNERGDPILYLAYDQSSLNDFKNKHTSFVSFDLPNDLKATDELNVYIWNPNHLKINYKGMQFHKIKRF